MTCFLSLRRNIQQKYDRIKNGFQEFLTKNKSIDKNEVCDRYFMNGKHVSANF